MIRWRGENTSVIVALSIIAALSIMTACTAAAAAGPPRPDDGDHLSVGERIADRLERKGIPKEWVIVIISMLPIVELRGAIPVGINFFKMDAWWRVYILAVIGNMIPIPFILLLLGPASRYLMRFRLGRLFFEWLFRRTRRKSAEIEKYETLGLAIFVAIPLPVTGGWTGALAAFLLGIKFHHAIWSIVLGVLTAGAIVTSLSLLGWVGGIIAGAALLGLAVTALWKGMKKERERRGKMGYQSGGSSL
ncbi:MAG: small multi-drug export protein [bacterium]|nr:small multi-drug export protein [bacterium]